MCSIATGLPFYRKGILCDLISPLRKLLTVQTLALISITWELSHPWAIIDKGKKKKLV
ncbi:hypothetical protein OIDMADRAFT_16799 [Oidiodendron maius Zn]|uniref:Uncharacterized protein n=1 Tax=Oidiodendron maius (strain Zn) TaxID=913774 RepID=A0A0C3DCA5_OIDMZ|nr:hypothetical protein OIDMADRAFT_16799 [Oidiodendron maius Zn]